MGSHMLSKIWLSAQTKEVIKIETYQDKAIEILREWLINLLQEKDLYGARKISRALEIVIELSNSEMPVEAPPTDRTR